MTLLIFKAGLGITWDIVWREGVNLGWFLDVEITSSRFTLCQRDFFKNANHSILLSCLKPIKVSHYIWNKTVKRLQISGWHFNIQSSVGRTLIQDFSLSETYSPACSYQILGLNVTLSTSMPSWSFAITASCSFLSEYKYKFILLVWYLLLQIVIYTRETVTDEISWEVECEVEISLGTLLGSTPINTCWAKERGLGIIQSVDTGCPEGAWLWTK